MPRAIWSGSVSFGLVTIPVRLFPAVKRKTVRFNQLDARTGTRIRQQKVSSVDGSEIPREQLVRGYELAPDTFVTITDDELASLDPEASRTIDVLEFVELADIDPVFFDSAYWLVPDEIAAKAYRLLAEALSVSGKVGVARFVMRTKQYLAALRPRDGALTMSTMVYADEVVGAETVEGLEAVAEVEVDARELEVALQLIESLSEDFDASTHTDSHREAVLELIERKRTGEVEVVTPTPSATADRVVDLMAALEASVAQADKAKKRHPSAAEKKSASRKSA
ncbi:MAG: Ku protein [Acidimicrobiia bacterium]|nr:Ku protein [Acidimicrobiia bacterium]